MKHFIKYIIPSAAVVLSLGLSSCAGDLDVDPIDPNQTTSGENLADNLLNKCYANMALAGQSGPDGDSDVDGIDGGTSGFLRQLFNHNELASDNFVCSWGDPGISDFNYMEFNSSNVMTAGLYYRCWAGIKDCNLYLANYGDADAEKAAEARFMRALYYYELMDLFGNVPFATSLTESPVRITRSDLCKWVVSELRSIENTLSAPTSTPNEGQEGYGRANKYTDQLLLARIYLNSQVYTGVARNDSALYYAQQVIKTSPYKLHTTAKSSKWTAYQELFMGDNGQNGAAEESLLSLSQDGATTASYGTTLFMMASTEASTLEFQDGYVSNNTTEGWAGNRARPELVREFFPRDDAPQDANVKNMYTAAGDDRALFENLGAKPWRILRLLHSPKVTQWLSGATGMLVQAKSTMPSSPTPTSSSSASQRLISSRLRPTHVSMAALLPVSVLRPSTLCVAVPMLRRRLQVTTSTTSATSGTASSTASCSVVRPSYASTAMVAATTTGHGRVVCPMVVALLQP